VLKNNGFHNRHSPILRAFSPLSLFSGGAPGAWYDPSDYTTLFQDSAGTTPVTAVEQPVGLMLDKSQGLVLGPELVPDSSFDSAASWTAQNGDWVVAGGKATYTESATAVVYLESNANISLDAGKWYEISCTISGIASGSAVFGLFNKAASVNLMGGYVTVATNGTYVQRIFVASSVTGIRIYGNNSGSSTSWSLDSFSIKALPGNHAFQATSASRPVLSARYNLLTKTEQFDDAVWSKVTDTITANQAVAPDGTMTADLWTHTSGRIQVNATLANTTTSLYIKFISGGSTITINTAGNVAADEVVFNLSTLTVTTLGANNTAATITAVNDGWLRLTVTRGATAGSTLYFGLGSPASNNYIWGASIVPANQSTLPYQRVNTSTDYATTGFLPYLKFDGVDDSLSTNSISFTSTDKMSVFAGVRKLSDVSFGVISELGTNSFGVAGSFGLFANGGAASTGPFYAAFGTGTSSYAADFQTFTAPISNVVTAQWDIAQSTGTTEVTLRANGAAATRGATSGTSMGTGNFGNYPLYIGRRGGSSLPFSGQMYSMIIVGKAVTAGELSSTETYVNQKTGAY
jgi:hypothetical protein